MINSVGSSRISTPPVLKRTICITGGMSMVVYGTFPTIVENALRDTWLSVAEMSTLWKTGEHKSNTTDNSRHDMMEMLTQRSLSFNEGAFRAALSITERLTWDGITANEGVKRLGLLSVEGGKGVQITRYDHYMEHAPNFNLRRPGAAVNALGPNVHQFNMTRHLNEIRAAATIAPDDKGDLCRLTYLRYVMQYPEAFDERVANLPLPTSAEMEKYRLIMKANPVNYSKLYQLANEMCLPAF
jgi:hypothetical protein